MQNDLVVLVNLSSLDFAVADLDLLMANRVVLYQVDLGSLAFSGTWRELLSGDEQERAARFHFERDRQHYCAVRIILRRLLGRYLEMPPQDLNFRYSDKLKPMLAQRKTGRDIAFNVSHSGELALLGFTLRESIGVDVEKIRDDFDTAAIARRFFSPIEQDRLLRLPAEERHRAFFRAWTRKEAFIKALGEGLSHPLAQFDVSLDDGPDVSLATRPNAEEARRWWLQSIDVGPGYAAAFAVSAS